MSNRRAYRNRPTRRPARRTPRSVRRRASLHGLPRWLTVSLVGMLVVAAVSGFGFWIAGNATPPEAAGPVISVEIQVDEGTAVDYADVTNRVTKLALAVPADENAHVIIHKGGTAFVRTADFGTAVIRNGIAEQNQQLREKVLTERIADAMSATQSAVVSGSGRDLLGLLTAARSDRPVSGDWQIVYVSLGLGTVAPLQQSILQAGEPQSAAASVPADQLPKLDGATVNWIFPSVAGPQPPVTALTAQWRNLFLTGLVNRTGATMGDFTEPNLPGTVDAHAGAVPAVPNLNGTTAQPAPTPPPAPGQPYVATIHAGASFAPGSSDLIDETGVKAQLAGLVAGLLSGEYVSVACVGHAQLNSEPYAGFDVALSNDRSNTIGQILVGMGVPAALVSTRGAGHDEPVPGDDQRVVECTATPR